jgi:hypothetical protein
MVKRTNVPLTNRIKLSGVRTTEIFSSIVFSYFVFEEILKSCHPIVKWLKLIALKKYFCGFKVNIERIISS